MRAVAGGQMTSPALLQLGDLGLGEGPERESLPDVTGGLVGQMNHVRGVEPVISQLVHDYLIGWEIISSLRIGPDNIVHGEQQRPFADLVVVGTVL